MIDFVRNQYVGQRNPQPAENLLKSAYSLNRKGDSLFITNHFDQAAENYHKSLELYRESGDLQGVALSYARLGRVLEILGDFDEAHDSYKESLEIFENISDLQGIARGKAHLGNLGWATGDYHEANGHLQEALSLYHVAEDIPGEAWVYDLMGNLRLAMRDDDEAERYYYKAYSMVEALGANLENTAWDHFHNGALALFRGQMERAKVSFTEAMKCFLKLKDQLGQVATTIHLGEIACLQKDQVEAQKHLSKAVQMVVPTHCKPLIADVLTGIAQLLKLQGDERKAITILMVALSHPTCRQQTKDRMVALATSLKANFSPKEAEEGFRWAKDVLLEEMAFGWASSTNKNKKSK